MPELRTTDCGEVGHPELVIRYRDPDDEPHVRRWSELVIERVWDGEVMRNGQQDRCYGWPVKLVADGAHLAVHEDDLTGDDDNPRFVSNLDQAARWTRAQCEVANSYRLALSVIDMRLATLQVCPDARDSMYLIGHLVRSSTAIVEELLASSPRLRQLPGPHPSGWYLACHAPDCRGRGPRGVWHSIRVVELLRNRPDLVPFLALPPGAVVNLSSVREPEVGTLRSNVSLAPEWNPLVLEANELQRRFALLVDVDWIPLPIGSAWHARTHDVRELVLDPSTDPELGRRHYNVEAVMARHGVNHPTATRALRDALVPARWIAWLAARHRDGLAGHFERVLADLERPEPERWRLHHAIARALHVETQQPFSEIVPKIASLDRDLEDLRTRAAQLAL